MTNLSFPRIVYYKSKPHDPRNRPENLECVRVNSLEEMLALGDDITQTPIFAEIEGDPADPTQRFVEISEQELDDLDKARAEIEASEASEASAEEAKIIEAEVVLEEVAPSTPKKVKNVRKNRS